MSSNYTEIIRRPLVTEKGSQHLKDNVYSFEVLSEASKGQITKAIEEVFKVKVDTVRTINSRKRAKRVGRFLGSVTHYKKALVKLKEGHKIKIFEGV
ncbi:MAG: 50S ribosomal protein L23 [Oligoflexia bacterium]|nr:50S ribosomal protein L23 [Oligoflexia bacterium]